MSATCGSWSVFARLRDSGLLGVDSSRVKDREGSSFAGRADIVATVNVGQVGAIAMDVKVAETGVVGAHATNVMRYGTVQYFRVYRRPL